MRSVASTTEHGPSANHDLFFTRAIGESRPPNTISFSVHLLEERFDPFSCRRSVLLNQSAEDGPTARKQYLLNENNIASHLLVPSAPFSSGAEGARRCEAMLFSFRPATYTKSASLVPKQYQTNHQFNNILLNNYT